MSDDITLSSVMTALLFMLLVAFAALAWRVMTDDKNQLECWQFIATRGSDGRHYADLDKVGKLSGIVFGSWAVVKLAYTATDMTGYALVLSAYFAFVGGVAGYSAFLRSKKTTPTAQP